MREIRLICKKELSRVLTDRKMLFSVFLLPAIIMVVVMNVMTSFSKNLENDVKSHAPIVYLQIMIHSLLLPIPLRIITNGY